MKTTTCPVYLAAKRAYTEGRSPVSALRFERADSQVWITEEGRGLKVFASMEAAVKYRDAKISRARRSFM